MLVAVIALVLALGGTAVAGTNAVISALSKSKVKKISKSVANKQITKRAPKLSVAKAALADNATHATSAQEAAKLGGFEASQLVRAASATAGGTGDPCGGAVLTGFSSTTFTTVVSRSVTAPTKGLLLVFGNLNAEWDSASTPGSELRLLGRLTVDGQQAGVEGQETLHEIPLPCEEGRTMSLEGVREVSAGTHTVAFQAANSTISGGAGKAFIAGSNVSTLFVPFGNGGAQGVTGAIASAVAGGGGNNN
jgi:hypothetical protein